MLIRLGTGSLVPGRLYLVRLLLFAVNYLIIYEYSENNKFPKIYSESH